MLFVTTKRWGRVTHICVGKLTTIGSDNGLSPERHQAIIWTNAGILLIGPLGTNFSEILIEIQTFSLKKIRLKMSSAKCCAFRLGLNVVNHGFVAPVSIQQLSNSNMTPSIMLPYLFFLFSVVQRRCYKIDISCQIPEIPIKLGGWGTM